MANWNSIKFICISSFSFRFGTWVLFLLWLLWGLALLLFSWPGLSFLVRLFFLLCFLFLWWFLLFLLYFFRLLGLFGGFLLLFLNFLLCFLFLLLILRLLFLVFHLRSLFIEVFLHLFNCSKSVRNRVLDLLRKLSVCFIIAFRFKIWIPPEISAPSRLNYFTKSSSDE